MLANFIPHIFFHNRLLDRDQVGHEEATLDDEEEDGFLKAFKVDLSYSHAYTFLCYKCLFKIDLSDILVCCELCCH